MSELLNAVEEGQQGLLEKQEAEQQQRMIQEEQRRQSAPLELERVLLQNLGINVIVPLASSVRQTVYQEGDLLLSFESFSYGAGCGDGIAVLRTCVVCGKQTREVFKGYYLNDARTKRIQFARLLEREPRCRNAIDTIEPDCAEPTLQEVLELALSYISTVEQRNVTRIIGGIRGRDVNLAEALARHVRR